MLSSRLTRAVMAIVKFKLFRNVFSWKWVDCDLEIIERFLQDLVKEVGGCWKGKDEGDGNKQSENPSWRFRKSALVE